MYNELKSIDLNILISNLETKENSRLLDWIKSDSFYSDCRDKIQNSTSKIIDHYYSHLRGGWSINNEVWKLINDYAETDYFLSENYIIYDKFTEYKEINETFIEGLFASHSIHSSNNTGLESFDDWLVTKIILNGSSDSIIKFFLRYKLKEIKYKETSSQEDSFSHLINNFFSNNRLRESFLAHCEKGNRSFWDNYNTIFCNILTVISICNFDEILINEISTKLIDYLRHETFISPSNIKYVRSFILRVGHKLEFKILSDFFYLAIGNPKYHDEYYFDVISDLFHDRKFSIDISPEDFERIINFSFEQCKDCNSRHPSTIIIPIYSIINNKTYKLKIIETIADALNKSFDFNLFYLATIFKIIEFNDSLFNKFIDLAYPLDNQRSIKNVLLGKVDDRFDRVNHLINICFKFDIDTLDERFNKFRTLNSYYNWLLDMKSFDYNNFTPSWITEFPLKYYYRKISQSKQVKAVVEKYLLINFDGKIEEAYFNIYIRKTWKKN